jgi:hypothetical protein
MVGVTYSDKSCASPDPARFPPAEATSTHGPSWGKTMTHRESRCHAKIFFAVVLGYLEVFAREWPEWTSERSTKYGEPIGDDTRGSQVIELASDWRCFLVDGWITLTAELMRMVVLQERTEWHCQNHRVQGSALNKSQAEWRTTISPHKDRQSQTDSLLPLPCEWLQVFHGSLSPSIHSSRSTRQLIFDPSSNPVWQAEPDVTFDKNIDRHVYWFACVAFGFSHLAFLGLGSNAILGMVRCLVRRSRC